MLAICRWESYLAQLNSARHQKIVIGSLTHLPYEKGHAVDAVQSSRLGFRSEMRCESRQNLHCFVFRLLFESKPGDKVLLEFDLHALLSSIS